MKRYLFPVLQIIIVLGVILSFYSISWFGDSYRFRAEPYDPFSPVYGEYVMLQYPDLKPADSVKKGLVYVTFTTGSDGYAKIDRISNDRFFGSVAGDYYDKYVTIPQLNQYYVEQGTGKGYEDAKKLEVKADVSPWGTVRATDLSVRK
ncbi:GDYXXLXY domain-containing protein [Exiguobacterium artemiae]|uniref:GDYXXLXY domain-containing protein n=1 Tax=Exiguobacterium artemiae TaxID=340145 RepID=UPI002963D183|nr:GDYXXLXY domain-containing protein [Exiguobacterium sibiricum]MDW2884540.1 GDYXXLXY domain-containing protein [Exiguobacterium sibiricum]